MRGHSRSGRFEYQVEDRGYVTDCWIWAGTIDAVTGYGRGLNSHRQYRGAHRVSYEKFRGPIPEGLTLDHLCRVKSCVNPDHLEPVTNAENIRRAWVDRPPRQLQTHCQRGHSLEGLPITTHSKSGGRFRVCRTCINESQRRRREINRTIEESVK